MTLPNKVKIVEVSPRDGLQNEAETVPTKLKIKYINALSETGLSVIEPTSFVSPKWVPQMADHTKVMQNITRNNNTQYPALVPNEQGFEAALEAGVKEIAVFTAASETFSHKNTNCSIKESLNRAEKIMTLAKQNNINVRAYVSCIIACPFEGPTKPQQVSDVAHTLYQMGAQEISLGDTLGVGTPLLCQTMLETVTKQIPIDKLAVHYHDTYGQALANIYASLQLGVSIIDSSVAGLGGCPYAPGAGGNVATEDVLYLLNGLGIQTDVDLTKIIAASEILLNYLKRPSKSKVALAIMARKQKG